MEQGDLEKYLLEQAKIEVEHTRSWPTKVMAFYVTINFGLLASILAAVRSSSGQIRVPYCVKLIITLAIAGLFAWAASLLIKNHRSYLRHRNIQIQFQRKHFEEHKDSYALPPDWFIPNEISLSVRALGWGFYFYIMVVVTALTVAGIWVSG